MAKTKASLPRTRRLRGGQDVALRLMTADDAEAILGFSQTLAEEDVLFLRSDITTPEGVAYWVANIETGATVSLLAEIDGAITGYASVHLNPARWTRRVGELRVNVGPAYRSLGLGRVLVNEIFDLARTLDLKKLSAQMTVEQQRAGQVFRKLGFRAEAILTDWVEDRAGKPHDLVVMAYDLEGLSDQVDEPLRV